MSIKKLLPGIVFFLVGCAGVPEGLKPVDNFQLERYLGKWYEIARLDHSFERGLSRVTAEYSMNPDKTVRVINRGYSAKEDKWKEAEGKARFADRPDVGFLEVSFCGPFYGSYVILHLDRENYSHALVSGPNRSYFWILARTPVISDDLKNTLVAKATEMGFETNKLIWVKHD